MFCPSVAAYFGDLGDGIHKGNEDDPRVSIIEVIPDEVIYSTYILLLLPLTSHFQIRYWVATKGSIGRTMSTAVGAVTGKGKAPGELRTISHQEVSRRLMLLRPCW